MPRPRNPKNEAHRQRQQRYRRKLKATGTPEASAVDIALSGAYAAYAEHLRRQEEEARAKSRARREELRLLIAEGRLSGREQDEAYAEAMAEPEFEHEPLEPKAMLSSILRGAVSLLVEDGYHPRRACSILIRRLGRGSDARELDRLIEKSGVARKRRTASANHVTV